MKTMANLTCLSIALILVLVQGDKLAKKCGESPFETRVIGGEEANESGWPWMAAIVEKGKSNTSDVTFLCGATLITDNGTLLTAASCLTNYTKEEDYEKLEVRLGVIRYIDEGKSFSVSKIIANDKFNETSLENDIALVKISGYLQGNNKKIGSICIRYKSLRGKEAYFIGFGKPLKSKLYQAKLPIISKKKCRDANSENNIKITKKQICAGDEEHTTCKRDMGGPLMDYDSISGKNIWYQVGVASRNDADTTKDSCVNPGVFTKVSEYLFWINKTLSVICM